MRWQVVMVAVMLSLGLPQAFATEGSVGVVTAAGAENLFVSKTTDAKTSEKPLSLGDDIYSNFILVNNSATDQPSVDLEKVGQVFIHQKSAISVAEVMEQGAAAQGKAAGQTNLRETVVGLLEGGVDIARTQHQDAFRVVTPSANISFRGTLAGLQLVGGATLGVLKKQDNGHESTVDITTPGNTNPQTVTTEGTAGIIFFKVENGDVQKNPAVQQQIENEMRQAGFDRGTRLSYLNNWDTINKNYDQILLRGGTQTDVVVNFSGLADTIKAPATEAKKVSIAAAGNFRQEANYPSQSALYASYIDGSNVNINHVPNNDPRRNPLLFPPTFPFVQHTYDYIDPRFGNLSSSGFSVSGLMANTPDVLEPLLTDRIFLVDNLNDPIDPNRTLFLNSFKVNHEHNIFPGTDIEYGSWTVPIVRENFTNQVILAPTISEKNGFSESYLTASPVFYWVTQPDLLTKLPTSVTFLFDGGVFKATDTFYRSSLGLLPTASGYLTFDFSSGALKPLSGMLNVNVPYDQFLTESVLGGVQAWNVIDFKGSTFMVDELGNYSIVLGDPTLPGAPKTKHFNPLTNVTSGFDGKITGKIGGGNTKTLTGAFSFIEPQTSLDPLNPEPINGLSGIFIANDSSTSPAGEYSAQLKNAYHALPDPAIGQPQALMAFGENGGILHADTIGDSPHQGVIKGDKVFGNKSDQTLVFNPNDLRSFDTPETTVRLPDATPINYGVWNAHDGVSPQVMTSVQLADVSAAVSGFGPARTQQSASEMPWISAVPLAVLPTSGSVSFDFSSANIVGYDSFGTPIANGKGTLHFDFSTPQPTVSASNVEFNVDFGLIDTWKVHDTGPVPLSATTIIPVTSGTYTSAASNGTTHNFSGSIGTMLTHSVDPVTPNVVGAVNFKVDDQGSQNFDKLNDASYLKGVFYGPTVVPAP